MPSSLTEQRRKEKGLCPRCGVQSDKPKRLHCTSCLKRAADVRRKRREAYRKQGLCTQCGSECVHNLTTCDKCRQQVLRSKEKNWAVRCVAISRNTDKHWPLRVSDNPYVTAEHLEKLNNLQKNRCAYCKVEMQVKTRMKPNGLTIQRLDNSKPHTCNNCVLACFRCNVRRVENGKKDAYILCRKMLHYWKNHV